MISRIVISILLFQGIPIIFSLSYILVCSIIFIENFIFIDNQEDKMKKITYEVMNPLGIHARPAAFVAQACVALPSQIVIKI